MVSIASLWLPILLTAVAVFIASSVIWMATPLHKKDWSKLPDEGAFKALVKSQALRGGLYMFPHCAHGDMKSPEAQARMKEGPWGTLTVIGTMPTMGRALGLWFVHLVIVAVFIAYVGSLSLGAGEPAMHVFRITSAMAWIAYAGGALPSVGWEGKPWSFALKQVFDGLIYALIAGAIFAWLWPEAAAS
jgi:hypothetical protein